MIATERSMGRRPPEPHHAVGDPGAAGERLQPRQHISVVSQFFGRRLDYPPHGQAVHHGPDRQSVKLQEKCHGDPCRGTVHQPLREIAAGHGARIRGHQNPEPEEQVASPAHADHADKIAETNALPAREVPHAEQTAEVAEIRVEGPPLARRPERRGAMLGEKNQRQQGLQRQPQSGARHDQQQRSGPCNAPGSYALLDLRSRIDRRGNCAFDFARLQHAAQFPAKPPP